MSGCSPTIRWMITLNEVGVFHHQLPFSPRLLGFEPFYQILGMRMGTNQRQMAAGREMVGGLTHKNALMLSWPLDRLMGRKRYNAVDVEPQRPHFKRFPGAFRL